MSPSGASPEPPLPSSSSGPGPGPQPDPELSSGASPDPSSSMYTLSGDNGPSFWARAASSVDVEKVAPSWKTQFANVSDLLNYLLVRSFTLT